MVMNKLMLRFRYIAVLFLIMAVPTFAGPGPADLTENCDPVLQKGLERCLTALKLNKAAEKKNLSIVLVDITNPDLPRMAYINPNEMMYAASLPKIAILLGAFDRIAKGKMTLDDKTREKLALMIRNSSNQAATEILNEVGKSYLADLLQSRGIAAAAVENVRDTLENDPQLAEHYVRMRQPCEPQAEIVVDREAIRVVGREQPLARAPMRGEHDATTTPASSCSLMASVIRRCPGSEHMYL